MINLEDDNLDDEIAKIYAMEDMKDERKKSIKKQADSVYSGFDINSIEDTANALVDLIHNDKMTLTKANDMLTTMIKIYEEYEEYEKCHVCNQIKKRINDKI